MLLLVLPNKSQEVRTNNSVVWLLRLYTQDGSLFIVKHISVSQPSYALDVHMDESL